MEYIDRSNPSVDWITKVWFWSLKNTTKTPQLKNKQINKQTKNSKQNKTEQKAKKEKPQKTQQKNPEKISPAVTVFN